MLISYRAQGCIAVISDWVNGGFKELEELIVNIISRLDSNTGSIFR